MTKTVILIDDDSDDLDIMKEAISQVDSNLTCISFIYPQEAIRLLSKELILLPDYIFIDINMPMITGPECLKALRNLQEFRQIPIIMYSTTMTSKVSGDLLLGGASYTFQKPYSVNDYLRILESIFYTTISPPSHIS